MNKRNNKGFTLLEAMIAILLLSLIMLMALQGLMSAYIYVDRSSLRDEAVRISDTMLTTARNTAYTNLNTLDTTGSPVDVTRQIRSYDVTYSVTTTVTTVSPLRSVKITVTWNHKGTPYTYTDTTLIGDT